MKYIGIDVSKDTFVVAYSPKKTQAVRTFSNDVKGIHKFIQSISKEEHHCVMEATGNYSMLLLYLLSKGGYHVSMVNPVRTKNFARMMLNTIKTDAVDARLIALFGEKMTPEPYILKSDTVMLLKQKRSVLRQLKKQLIASSNLLKSIEVLPVKDAKCISSLNKVIKSLKCQIASLEDDMVNLSNQEYKHQMDLLLSVKGIGENIATALIAITGGFTYFASAKQLTRFLGLSPNYEQSGTSVNKRGHINRQGDSGLRAQLYVAAFSCLRWNSACKATYERLKTRGKSGKIALIAVANKLVRQAFAVVTQDRPFVNGYISVRPI